MRKKILLSVCFLLFLLALAPAPAENLCESCGRFRVICAGEKTELPRDGKYPILYLPDYFPEKDETLWLDYEFYDYGTEEADEINGIYDRHWELLLLDQDGNYVDYRGRHVLYLPYPSVWSKEQEIYWKWTEAFAKKHYTWQMTSGAAWDFEIDNWYFSLYWIYPFESTDGHNEYGLIFRFFGALEDYGSDFYIRYTSLPAPSRIKSAHRTEKNTVKLVWERSDDATGYEIQYCTSPGFPKDSTHTLRITKNSTVTASVKDLRWDRKYRFRIRTYLEKDGGTEYSPWNSETCVTIPKKKYADL